MPAIVAQKVDVVQRLEPIGVVDQDRVLLPRAEAQELPEHRFDARDIRGDFGVGKDLAHLVLAGGIAHLGGAAPDEHDGPVPGLLKLPEQHDADQVAHMQARGRAVEADIAGDDFRPRELIERRFVGALVDVAARGELLEKVRFDGAHGVREGARGSIWRSPEPLSGLRGEYQTCASTRPSPSASSVCPGACRDSRRPPP